MNPREIKFRCWDKEYEEMYTSKHFSVSFDGKVQPDRRDSWKDDQFILEQWTGLKDENLKEVFEGDVVVLKEKGGVSPSNSGSERIEYVALVAFGEGRYGITLPGSTYFGGLNEWLKNFEIEVIGNIHENLELLK